MSSPIQPPQGPGSAAAVPAPKGVSAATAASGAGSPSEIGDEAVSIETIPSAPPPDVLDEITSAAGAYATLQSQGLSVRYSYDAGSRRASAELVDAEGGLVRSLTASEALALAAAESPAL